jgi:hypothetical protein
LTGLLADKREQVAEPCRRHGVLRLEAFGSAARGSLDPASSDLDFLVEFQPLGPGHRADAYFGLLEDLEALFGRPVDLVMTRAVRNRYFLQAIEADRELLYAA